MRKDCKQFVSLKLKYLYFNPNPKLTSLTIAYKIFSVLEIFRFRNVFFQVYFYKFYDLFLHLIFSLFCSKLLRDMNCPKKVHLKMFIKTSKQKNMISTVTMEFLNEILNLFNFLFNLFQLKVSNQVYTRFQQFNFLNKSFRLSPNDLQSAILYKKLVNYLVQGVSINIGLSNNIKKSYLSDS